MSGKYIITWDETEYREKSKDDVITMLMALWSASTGTPIRVEWPDGSFSERKGFD